MPIETPVNFLPPLAVPFPLSERDYMLSRYLPIYSAIAGFTTVGLACLIARDIRGPRQVPQKLVDPPSVSAPAERMVATAPAVLPAQTAAAAQPLAGPAADERYYGQLRSSVRWVQARMGNGEFITPDRETRVLLAKSAAQRAGLASVGLGWRDVYGIITAETSWVPRMGRSKDGTPNLGIAQFEPATARALGLRNPDDVVEAVHVAALHMKEAALWSADRISGLKLGADERAAKLREGVSIYYNLSSRGRASWNGRNTARLPAETLRHIANARIGAHEAAMLDGQSGAVKYNGGANLSVASSGVPTLR